MPQTRIPKKKTKPCSEVWNFVENDEESGKSKCMFCKKLLVKSAAKLKYHMINACSNIQDNIKTKLIAESNKWVHRQTKERAVETKTSNPGKDMSVTISDCISDSDDDTATYSCTASSLMSASQSTRTQNFSEGSSGSMSVVKHRAKHQASIKSYLDVVTPSESKKLDILVARAFYSNRLPFRIIEEKNFVEMVKSLRCGYILPNRRQLSGEYLNMEYDRVMVISKSLIAKSPGVTLVIDGWSNIRHDSIVNFVICTPQPIFYKSVNTGSNRHTADYLFRISKEVVEEIGPLKFTAIVSDNASNMKAMWRIVRSEYPHILCYGCSAHALNLLTQDLCKLDAILIIINKTKSIVREIRDSLQKFAKFKEYMKKYAVQKGIKETTLCLPVNTRWYSVVKMLSSVLKAQRVLKQLAVDDEVTLLPENRKAILDTHTDDNTAPDNRNKSFWCKLQIIHDLLKPIADGIAIAESNSTSIASVPEIFIGIKEKLKQCDSHFSQQDTKKINEIIQQREDFVLTSTHKLANILDPRFRGQSLNDTEKTQAVLNLEFYMKEYGFWENETRRSNIFSSYFKYIQKEGPFKPCLYWDSENMKNPVTWWKMFQNFSEVSDFATIATRLLSVPSSSASVEREFSCQSRIHTKDRNKLSNETVEKLLAVEHNLKFLDPADGGNNFTDPKSLQTNNGKYKHYPI